MKLFADESIEKEIVQHLRKENHQVLHVQEIQPGLTDEEVLAKARDAHAILLTHDKDFGSLVFQKKLLTTGVILCRLSDLQTEVKAHLLGKTIRDYSDELQGAFAVLTKDEFRIRKL
jgi:predicted nuclease of predicted toxin-antitoxin system